MNCKPGDIAYIVRDDETPCDIGKVVEVVRLCPPHEWLDPHVPEWECYSRTPLKCFMMDGILSVESFEVDIRDSCLRPIGGISICDETPIETNIPEAVKLAWGVDAPVLS